VNDFFTVSTVPVLLNVVITETFSGVAPCQRNRRRHARHHHHANGSCFAISWTTELLCAHGCLNLTVLMRFILPKLVLQGSSEHPSNSQTSFFLASDYFKPWTWQPKHTFSFCTSGGAKKAAFPSLFTFF
jgi:hypothetical protein